MGSSFQVFGCRVARVGFITAGQAGSTVGQNIKGN